MTTQFYFDNFIIMITTTILHCNICYMLIYMLVVVCSGLVEELGGDTTFTVIGQLEQQQPQPVSTS